jgi:hypothetical protein
MLEYANSVKQTVAEKKTIQKQKSFTKSENLKLPPIISAQKDAELRALEEEHIRDMKVVENIIRELRM